MGSFSVSLPANWEEFLKRLANDHEIDVSKVIKELCEWAFSNSEGKTQFEAWLDDAYPPKGEAEDEAMTEDEEAIDAEEENEDEAEEEVHEDRNYSEDKEPNL
jgi:hypothetical protein